MENLIDSEYDRGWNDAKKKEKRNIKELDSKITIYQSECGMNTVDVYHLIKSQIKTINTQQDVIELLRDNAKLTKERNDAWDEYNDTMHN